MDETEHGPERADETLNEVIMESAVGLATVGKAVREVNETLAVHAAWTEERFEAVDDRLVSLSHVLVLTSGKVEMQIAGVNARLAGWEVKQSEIAQTLSRLEQAYATLLQRDTKMLHKIEHLERSQQALQHGLTMLADTVQGLTTRVGEVLANAISDEMNHRLTKPTGEAACQ